MTVRSINLHSFPGRSKGNGRHGTQRRKSKRFGDRAALILVATAERYGVPEHPGIVFGLSVHGKTVIGATVATPDSGLSPSEIHLWAQRSRLGPLLRPVGVTDHRGFTDPDSGRFTLAYKGAEWIVTADQGRSLGLLAEHWAPCTDRFWRGGHSIGIAGWGRLEEWTDKIGRKNRKWRGRLHEPVLRLKPIGPHGLMAGFGGAGRGGRGPDGRPAGRWEKDPATGELRPSRGWLVDLIGQAHAFDGIDTADLSEHLAAFGLPQVGVPAAVAVDVEGAQQLLDVALAVHRLALVIDARAKSWGLGFGEVFSPGGIGQHQWRATGALPPLAKFTNLDDAALNRWAGAAHGGWHQ
jgi:hypothetical protein